jgi:hypothetical protein
MCSLYTASRDLRVSFKDAHESEIQHRLTIKPNYLTRHTITTKGQSK